MFDPPAATDSAAGALSFEQELAAVRAEMQQPRVAKAREKPPAEGDVRPPGAGERTHRGTDREIVLEVSLEEAIRGAIIPATYSFGQRRGSAFQESTLGLEIHIPKLARHGQKLVLKGKGAPGGDGGVPGDLHVEIAYKRHPLFRLRGDDVWYYFPIAPWEAVLGAILELPTLEDPFRVHVPAGTTSGQTFRLPGRGLPKTGGGRGDILASLRVATPKFPTDAEKQLYLQLSHVSRFNPRRGIS